MLRVVVTIRSRVCLEEGVLGFYLFKGFLWFGDGLKGD